MNRKKVMIISAVFLIAAASFILYMNHKKRITYGENAAWIQAEFPEMQGIESCHYKVEIIGSPFFDFIGPTNYHLTAVIIISNDEMDMIAGQYQGEKKNKYHEDEQIRIPIERRLIEGTGIDDETVWTFNREFQMKMLGWRYAGEVYYSQEENALYLEVENL
ncbi:MAG: hypothetical protein NC118_04330 [Eubacterium sp.]|nr:hypothetical protein [Eubacterium sp.]